MTVRIAGIVADITLETIVIVVTFMKTFNTRKNVGNTGPSFAGLLLKAGASMSNMRYGHY
jgi:hypothetical protein